MERIGRYRVIRKLGHGGMGDVVLAHDPTLERDVALKLLRGTQAGLREEALALAALRHPAIVTVFEIGEHEGHDYIAMEYVPGETLREILDARAPRDRLVAICAKVATAVAAAHKAGILHRDIKPENVIVDGDDVKVVDFGLARRLDDEPGLDEARRTLPPGMRLSAITSVVRDTLIDAPSVRGTPAYLAPELLDGAPATTASDVYSLGVMLYECLCGQRPHDAPTIVAAIAAMLEGPKPRLTDPLGVLVERMLALDPTTRPSLDEIVASLAPPPPRLPRKRWPFVVLGALVVVLAAVPILLVGRKPVSASIAVAPFSIVVPSYGREPLNANIVADVVAKLFAEVEGAKLAGTQVSGFAPRDAAHALHAEYFVQGAIEERHGLLHADVEIRKLDGDKPIATISVDRNAVAPLLDEVVHQLAQAITPSARLAREPDRSRAEKFYRDGQQLFRDSLFTESRPYFEQAADADPSYADAWYAVAISRAWMGAADELVQDAADKAVALVTDARAPIMRGISAFFRHDFAASRRALEPLSNLPRPDGPIVLYFLGEANWHDGRHDEAFKDFTRAIDLDGRFTPAAIHAWQYGVARRDAKIALEYIGREDRTWVDLAGRDYEAAAKHDTPVAAWAQVLLGRMTPGVKDKLAADTIESAIFRVGYAVSQHDIAGASREFETLWQKYVAHAENIPEVIYQLEGLGELVIAADMRDETRRVVGYLHDHSTKTPARNYARFSALAAPLLGDRSLLPHEHLTERERKLVDAAEAELGGDRAKAAQILDALVHDPTFTWDYPERAALLRNVGPQAAATLCAETDKPPIPRPAYFAVANLCASVH